MSFLPSWPPEINTLLLFGLLLFGGALGGYCAHRLRWLPSITGFMAVGLAVGPQGLGLIGPEGMAQAKIIVDVALALILYRLGLSLDLKALLADRRLLLVSLAEGVVATFVFIYAALGVALGWLLHWAARRTKRASQYHPALVIGGVMFALGGSQSLHLSGLFAPLMLGVTVRSLEQQSLIADLDFGAAFELFFIALFVYADANLHLAEMGQYAAAAGAFVLARGAAKLIAVGGLGYLTGVPVRQGLSAGLLLMPMAGLAIGLTATTLNLFPEQGAAVSAVVLAAVAVWRPLGRRWPRSPSAGRAIGWPPMKPTR